VQRIDKALELATSQPLSLENPASPIRQRHFEDVLCEIHRHRRSIHLGLLLVCGATHTSRQ
jgi:hypothetical protein